MVSGIISRVVILVFGTLYPAYASYKAVKTKNVKEYVKWMMYWIVFALFTTVETFADVLISWLEIDTTLDKVKSQGYSALVNVGQQGLNFAVQSAVTVSITLESSIFLVLAEFVSWGVFLCFSCTARWFQIANRDSCFTENSGLQFDDDDLKGAEQNDGSSNEEKL
ncbi:REEP3 [Bugula neritina]|uniref:Receptor expression-enhancing protein n=1 Tax=Bugula neritina TaxID=10212 RepID=A0A7J7JE60_BUGNE|nr:REEP3 [Bugula neritina]